MNQRERVESLSRVPLFDRCSKRDLSRLAATTRIESVDAGHTLFREGSTATNLYIVLAGSVSVRRGGRVVARVGPGEVIGELAVVLGGTRTATVVAETPMDWLVMDQRSLRQAIDTVPGLGWKLLSSMASRLSDTDLT
jgi:CRP/FNR family transcriptional regulator, cyclic AMP receptor protein